MPHAQLESSMKLHDGRFGERLFRARSRQGYSRREVVQLTGAAVNLRTLVRWETESEIEPRLGPGIRAVAEVLGVTLGHLFWGERED